MMCEGVNMTGVCHAHYDRELQVPYTAKSLEVQAGKFKVCSGKNMYLRCATVTYPLRVDDLSDSSQLAFSPLSLESDRKYL